MVFTVFVTAIVKGSFRTMATATNGGLEGPPSVTWELPTEEIPTCYVGKKYTLTVEPLV